MTHPNFKASRPLLPFAFSVRTLLALMLLVTATMACSDAKLQEATGTLTCGTETCSSETPLCLASIPGTVPIDENGNPLWSGPPKSCTVLPSACELSENACDCMGEALGYGPKACDCTQNTDGFINITCYGA